MSLNEIVKSWPKHWATCPVYRKGVETPSGSVAEGKQPLGRAHKTDLAPAASLHYCEKHPDTYGAIGVFSGPRSGGLLILDVDERLGVLKRTHKGDFDGPYIESPKRNAGKFLFYLDQADWAEVSDISLIASNEGWEALWGRMGVFAGAYHAGGEYQIIGDIQNIPPAPDWLVARMKLRKQDKEEASQAKKPALDPYRSRTKEQRHAIVSQCLKVIPTQGAGSNDFWWSIGAMIHSADLGDDGLELWRDWSKTDDDFAHLWEPGSKDHCEERWNAGFRGNGLGIGSLVGLADANDPERTRFAHNGLASIVAEAEAATVQFRQSFLTGEELLSRAKELEETHENPAILEQEKHLLAKEAGHMNSGPIDRMLDADLSFQRTGAFGPKKVVELNSEAFDYLIPGLLPKPWTLLVHADGGTGKTAMCQTIAKHISKGKAFNIHGGLVDVPVGKVLWLNGDQNERILRRQFMMIDAGDNIDVLGEWDMQWYRRFCKYQQANKYDLVVIDSLDGCNDSNPYEENRREFALPIKRLARRNGEDFPACSIVIIHHNTKEGKFRGTSAIKAACDETWNMKRATQNQIVEFGLAPQSRIVEVEKSRDDREGHRLVFHLLPDFTYQIGHMKRESSPVTSPNDHTLDVLAVLRAERKAWSVAELAERDDVGGEHRKRAIRYGLQRLEQQALVERCDPPAGKRHGRKPPVYYRATGTDVPGGFRKKGEVGIHQKCVSTDQNDCAGTEAVDKAVLSTDGFVNSSGSSTPTGACSTETIQRAVDKAPVDKTPVVNRNDCTGTKDAVDADLAVYREIDEDYWDDGVQSSALENVRPMERMDAIKAMADFDNCVDVSAEDVS